MSEDDDNPFWRFSLTLYVREGVAEACLRLQERLDLDVNLLLFCCWAGSRGRALSGPEIDGLIAATRDWRAQVVRPLRGARRWLKTRVPEMGSAAARLRQDIKAAELSAEAVQQALMHRALRVDDGPPAPEAVTRNMRAYLTALGHAPEVTDISDLAAVLRGCCPALTPLGAVRLLDSEPG